MDAVVDYLVSETETDESGAATTSHAVKISTVLDSPGDQDNHNAHAVHDMPGTDAAHDTSDTTNTTTFLDLSAELRNQIYEYHYEILAIMDLTTVSNHVPSINLALSCKQIKAEALGYFQDAKTTFQQHCDFRVDTKEASQETVNSLMPLPSCALVNIRQASQLILHTTANDLSFDVSFEPVNFDRYTSQSQLEWRATSPEGFHDAGGNICACKSCKIMSLCEGEIYEYVQRTNEDLPCSIDSDDIEDCHWCMEVSRQLCCKKCPPDSDCRDW